MAAKSSKKKGKGKKKKSTAGSSGGEGGIKEDTSPPILNDVSSFLFSKNNPPSSPLSLPYIGPISIIEGGKSIHGRGLITTKDVNPGECLFAVQATISVEANAVQYIIQQQNNNIVDGASLEQITEKYLVEAVSSLCDILNDEEIQPRENVDRARSLLAAFTAQMKDNEIPADIKSDELMETLLAKKIADSKDYTKLDKETILNIIRINAFGPDYHNYSKIAKYWSTSRDNTENYNRLLGVYPLAAMINHSCSPNAVRVFGRIPDTSDNDKSASEIDNIQGREVMIVHATTSIPKGTEITWSYIPPSTPFAPRRELLRSNYGFTCNCTRCTKEEEALKNTECQELFGVADNCWAMNQSSSEGEKVMLSLVPSIEQIFFSKELSNEAQRYLRVAYSTLYIQYFNATLNDENTNETLHIATQLHFSFVACNNASTEHLSIIHFCFDLASKMRASAIKANDTEAANKATLKVQFWTNQLKNAHMIRYGNLGDELENVRMVSRGVGFLLPCHLFNMSK